MNTAEFKDRQSSFEFFFRETHEFILNFKKECLKGWKQLLAKSIAITESCIKTQLDLVLTIN